jgi:UMF1 family MFS transporter
MAADFGITLGFDSTTIMGALVLVQFIAFFATLLYVKFADKIGVKNAIYFAIAAYMVIIFSGYFVTEGWHFYIIAGMIGCFQGGIQTLSRSLYARIIPENKSAQYFGFFNMWGKFAAVIGPLLMGSVTLILNNTIDDHVLSARIGLQSIMILFILGALVLSRVDISEGEKVAKEYL